MDVGQVAVAEDACVGVGSLQLFQQVQQSAFLPRCAGVGRLAVLVKASFVAHA